MKLEPFLDQENQAVYSLVREKIANEADFHDLTSALDIDERVYLDFNHITGDGNRVVFAELVARLDLQPRHERRCESKGGSC
jgi:hypothetical protein